MARKRRVDPWQKAMLAALDKVQSRVLPLGTVTAYAMKSVTDSQGFYYVLEFEGGEVVCTCKGFRYNDDCVHVKTVREDYVG